MLTARAAVIVLSAGPVAKVMMRHHRRKKKTVPTNTSDDNGSPASAGPCALKRSLLLCHKGGSLPIKLTGCPEYPWAFRRNWILHSRRPCRDSESQVHRRRLWLCHKPLFSCSFLYPFRHCLVAAGRAEMADVQQMEQIVPLITCEIPFCHCVCELVFGVNVFDLDLSRLILSNDQSCATLWVRDTCLIVGLLSLMIILITASLSSKNVEHRTELRETSAFDETESTESTERNSRVSRWIGTLVWSGVCLFDVVSRNESPRTPPLDLFDWFGEEMEHFSNQIPKIKSWNPIHA